MIITNPLVASSLITALLKSIRPLVVNSCRSFNRKQSLASSLLARSILASIKVSLVCILISLFLDFLIKR